MEDKKLTDTRFKFRNDLIKLSDLISEAQEATNKLYERSLNSDLYRNQIDQEIINNMAYELGLVTCHNKDLRLILSDILAYVTPELRKKYVERLKYLEDEYENKVGNKAYLAYM